MKWTKMLSKYKYIILFVIIYSIYIKVIEFYIHTNNQFKYEEKQHQRSMYTIDTIGCKIPKLEPFSNDTKKIFWAPINKDCYNISPPPFVIRSGNELMINYNISLKKYNQSKFSCCAQIFYTPNYFDKVKSILDKVIYEPCVTFNSTYHITSEFVKVSCSNSGGVFYKDFFITTPVKTKIEPENKRVNSYSVLIIGLDNISRMNFHRTMPKTLEYLRDHKVVELKGYNKVGDNSIPNLLPVLTGWSSKEVLSKCHRDLKKNYSCPFIWQLFKERGFVTAYGEDTAATGIFNYLGTGFIVQPTDYNMYSFTNEAEKEVGIMYDVITYRCMRHRWFYQVLLDYIHSLTITLTKANRQYFGFFWESSISHDYSNFPMLMDESFVKFFEEIESNGVLNSTIVILMSDHGIRWGKFRCTKQGRLEERLPFVYFLLPETFKANYPSANENLVKNTEKLTTPFDLHETIQDFLDLNTLNGTSIENRARELLPARGYSLFLPLPENRTCSDAGIADHWCTCYKSKTVSTKSAKILYLANLLVLYMNKLLKKYNQCSTLTLDNVFEASQFELSKRVIKEVKNRWIDYTLVISVLPSKGIFEATIRKTINGDFVITGTISRLDLYGSEMDTNAQYDALREYLKALDITNNVWVGLIKSNTDGEFTWTDYRGLSGDGYWISPPDDGVVPLCAMSDPSADYRWTAKGCGGPEIASFICELPVPQWATGRNGCMIKSEPTLTIAYIPESASVQLTADCGVFGFKKVQCLGDKSRGDLIKELECDEKKEETQPTITFSSPSSTEQEITDPSSTLVYTFTELSSDPTRKLIDDQFVESDGSSTSVQDTSNEAKTTDAALIIVPLNSDNTVGVINTNEINQDNSGSMIYKTDIDSIPSETIFSQSTDHFIPPLVMAKAKLSEDLELISKEEKMQKEKIYHTVGKHGISDKNLNVETTTFEVSTSTEVPKLNEMVMSTIKQTIETKIREINTKTTDKTEKNETSDEYISTTSESDTKTSEASAHETSVADMSNTSEAYKVETTENIVTTNLPTTIKQVPKLRKLKKFNVTIINFKKFKNTPVTSSKVKNEINAETTIKPSEISTKSVEKMTRMNEQRIKRIDDSRLLIKVILKDHSEKNKSELDVTTSSPELKLVHTTTIADHRGDIDIKNETSSTEDDQYKEDNLEIKNISSLNSETIYKPKRERIKYTQQKQKFNPFRILG